MTQSPRGMKDITPKEPNGFLNETKEQVGSFFAGAVPAAIGTGVVGGVYSLGSGLAGAIGLTGFAKATAGVLGVFFAATPVVIVGGAGAAAAFAGIAIKLNLEGRAKAAWAGAAVGAGAAIYAISTIGGDPEAIENGFFQNHVNDTEIVQLDDFRQVSDPNVIAIQSTDGVNQ